jgi:WXG100 family type VII secretion target
MTAFAATYSAVESSLNTMSQQSTIIETAVEDLMRQVNAALADWKGAGSEAYQPAQQACNQGILNLKTRLTKKISDCQGIMASYQGTDRAQAARF